MRRLRPLSEAECYARCYGGWDTSVQVLTPEAPSRQALALQGEALRRRFEELLDSRDPEELAEPEAA